MSKDDLKWIKEFTEELRLPDNPTGVERLLFHTVKQDMALLVEEVEQLLLERCPHMEKYGRLCEDPGKS